MITILALDPGRTTGYAIGRKDEHALKINYSQEQWNHRELASFIQRIKPNFTICESFEFRQGKQTGIDLYPCELIGVVKFLCDPDHLWMQTAAQGKGHFSDIKLKDMQLYKRGFQHGRDACRHLLQWYYFGSGSQHDDGVPIAF